MDILLINSNQVVSKLFSLCTREDNVTLDEVSTIKDMSLQHYEIIFVDEALYDESISEKILKLENIKKIFISYENDSINGFDITIKKPFLPSEVTNIIKSVQASSISNNNEISPQVLDGDEIEKIKSLLDMDESSEEIEEVLSNEEVEARKIALIKEHLIADGLEIVEKTSIADVVEIEKSTKPKKDCTAKVKKKKIKFTPKNMERIEDAVEMAMATMTKKQMKKLLKGKRIKISLKLKDNKA